MSLEENFWKRVVKTKSGCWSWSGSIKSNEGSALLWDGERYLKAHRVSYEIHTGSLIPTNHYIHRECANRACTNPDHLIVIPIERDVETRFWNCVEKSDDCWLWTGVVANNGYGQVNVPKPKRHMLAHRYSYELVNGKISPGLLVCHSCDVKLCVNPAHLFLGTHLDNNRDAVSKERNAHGERSPHSILTSEQAYAIKYTFTKTKVLAKKFNVAESTIYSIRNGYNWKHI